MKNLVVLGSTGSIGTQTLDVVRDNPELFHVSVLVANRSDELLEKQINEFQPELAVLSDEDAAKRLKSRYSGKTKIMGGREAVIEAAVFPEADTVVTSLMGFAGLEPTMAALEARKNIALANKETLVVAGELVMAKAKEMGCAILPVDSEHCALFQCLQGQDRNAVEKLILTASGGPFRGKQASELTEVTKSDVLAHPTWNMGQKITVDSASLVNKGLEVIEAKWLYGVTYDQIQVVVHPQSIVHSMVQYRDGTVMAQLGCTDMRLPIQYALTYPERVESRFPRVDFYE
uniref:1-deoxy-D-xylulose-5-phosphate reductoisomerase n=2 Tax=Anaerovibrio TaxID=82373 RepID=UPI0026EB5C50